jgi:hypothetical protein
MKTAIENLINGNLSDAKAKARPHGMTTLARVAEESFGLTKEKAIMAAAFLKGHCTFQSYCDAD